MSDLIKPLRRTILAYSISRGDDSPLFGETVTVVKLRDDDAGAYVVVQQNPSSGLPPGEVRLDPDEIDAVAHAARELLSQEGLRE